MLNMGRVLLADLLTEPLMLRLKREWVMRGTDDGEASGGGRTPKDGPAAAGGKRKEPPLERLPREPGATLDSDDDSDPGGGRAGHKKREKRDPAAEAAAARAAATEAERLLRAALRASPVDAFRALRVLPRVFYVRRTVDGEAKMRAALDAADAAAAASGSGAARAAVAVSRGLWQFEFLNDGHRALQTLREAAVAAAAAADGRGGDGAGGAAGALAGLSMAPVVVTQLGPDGRNEAEHLIEMGAAAMGMAGAAPARRMVTLMHKLEEVSRTLPRMGGQSPMPSVTTSQVSKKRKAADGASTSAAAEGRGPAAASPRAPPSMTRWAGPTGDEPESESGQVVQVSDPA